MQKLFENWRKYINEYGASGMGGNIATLAGAGRTPMSYDNLPKTTNFELGDDMDISVKTVLFLNDGSIILLKSSNKKDKRGFDLPGGHMRHGESREQALEREVFEETGLKINQIQDLHYNHGNKKFFCAQAESDDIMLSDEHYDYKIIKPEELNMCKMSKPFRKAIKLALELKDEQSNK